MYYDSGNCDYGSSAKDDLDVTELNVFFFYYLDHKKRKMIRDLQPYAQGYMFIEKMCCEFDSEIWDAKMF